MTRRGPRRRAVNGVAAPAEPAGLEVTGPEAMLPEAVDPPEVTVTDGTEAPVAAEAEVTEVQVLDEPAARSEEPGVEIAVLAWEWARQLSGTSFVAADRTVIAERLRELVELLVEALAAEPFRADPAIAVGEALVDVGFVAPASLARTVALLGTRFPAGAVPDLDPDVRRDRLTELCGTVGHGFVRAVRDRTLAQQEAIRSSAMLAYQRALHDQEEHALRDRLTGLLNRDGFAVRLERLARSEPAAVLGACLVCLDGFTAIDRGLGREVGDRIIGVLAERLAGRFARETELIGRIGRDEFLVAGLGGGSPADRLAEAQRAVSEPIELDGRSIVLSASCGLIARPAGKVEALPFLRDVDLAASWARSRAPGAAVVFDGVRAARQISDLALTADLPEAIRDGGLVPWFQPIVALPSGRIEGVEALARWPHPEHGTLTPDRFLALAERGGLITALGNAVLRQACAQARAWQLGTARPPRTAVNLAAGQLDRRQTLRDVMRVLEETELPAELLQLEITEHAALDDPTVLGVIQDLAGYGIGMVIDDFGTGRAHLAQLARLPAHGVTGLKLPADFLRPPGSPAGWSPDAGQTAVFGAVIELAHQLDMVVTVEGVETTAHAALAAELGADLAQGTLYGCAVPAEKLTDRLQ